MGSLKDPKTWIPHINPKDCSKKVCNIYCTKWCKFVILPSPPPRPPPPPPLVKDSLGGSFVSPVVIVIVALIGTLLVLIGYYVIISRYCSRNNGSSSMVERRVVENQETHDHEAVGVHGHDHVDDHAIYVPWLVLGKGLDEALIKSITICKYKRGDGLVSCTDCSVCLGEFQEHESLRLLPNCCHAFHVSCIDTWFKTHSNCPLCRANVCFEVIKDSSLISPSTLTPPPPPPPPMTNESSRRDVTLELRDEGERKITRSKSMDHYLCQTRVSTPQVMFFDQAKNMVQEVGFQADAGSSRNVSSKGNNIGLNIVDVSHFGVKRSFSSGRYSFTRECV